MEIDWTSPEPSNPDTYHQEMDFVQWISSDQSRTSLALEQSSFFSNIVLSVSDWNFNLWDIEKKILFFSSPKSHVGLTGGSWSPTRAGILFLSKSDGSIDVWDFTYSSYKPSATLITTPSRITSMQFLKTSLSSENEQLLAIGDDGGSLHIFEIPASLLAPNLNEKKIMSDFIERETRKLSFNDNIREKLDVSGTDASKAESSDNSGAKDEIEMEEIYQAFKKAFMEELGLAIE